MSGSGLKRVSEWDPRELPELRLGEGQYHGKSQHASRSLDFSGVNGPNQYCGEGNKRDAGELSCSTTAWDKEELYMTKMSPGFDDWRQQNCNCSSNNGWDRSQRNRSRSPTHGFKRESYNNRSIMAQPRIDYATSSCYASGDSSEYPQRIERPHGLCNDFYGHKYCGFYKGSTNEVFRERENNSTGKGASLIVQDRGHESLRGGDIPCKYFTAGNCQHGKFCRFSHHGQTHLIPDERSLNDWRRPSDNVVNMNKSRAGSKWTDASLLHSSELHDWSGNAKGSAGSSKRMANTWSVGPSSMPPMKSESHCSWSYPSLREENNESFSKAQNVVSKEELSQLANLSATLARLFANGEQLTQVFPSLNRQNSIETMPSYLSTSSGPFPPLAGAFVQPNPSISSEYQYVHASGRIEPSKPGISYPPGGFPSNLVEGKYFADAGPSETGVIEKKKGLGGDPLEKTGRDGNAGEDKSSVDAKVGRAFRFALVEFIKELLKPAWQNGKINKEDHKTIVKKVVDKVMASVQACYIPQSQEQISTYLSASKPKLDKLVQAYVERYQKS